MTVPHRTGPAPLKVRWHRSLRLPIALAVALVSLATVLAVGGIVEYRSAVDAKERLRAQTMERLDAAVIFYLSDGRLRLGATLDTAEVPATLVESAGTGNSVSYFDGATMWASQRISADRLLTVQISGTDLGEQRDDLRATLALAGLTAIGLSLVLGWLVATGLSRRLRRGADAARQIAAGASEIRAAQPGRDEVTALTRSVDAMADALRARLEVEKDFTADVAHELRTPVTALVSSAELLPDDELGRLVRAQVDRLRRLVADLLEISRLEGGREAVTVSRCDLGPVVSAAVQGLPDDGQVELTVQGSEPVRAEARRVERIVANLVTNARRHGGGPCRVLVTGRSVVVEDDGPGYPPSLLAGGPRRFSTHGRTGGSGLGLTIAQRQAMAQGGSLVLANIQPRGARATLTLPAWTEPAPADHGPA